MLFTHQDTCSSLSLFLSISLPPSLRYFVAVSREKLEEEAEELRAHQAESQARIESLMEQMMTIEQNMQHEAQARDEEQMQKLRDELEKTRLQQREDESKKLASLAAELKDVKGALDEEKGEKDRLTLLSPRLHDELRWVMRDRKGADWLIASRSGKRWTTRSVQRVVGAAAERAEVPGPVTPHTLLAPAAALLRQPPRPWESGATGSSLREGVRLSQ